MSETQKGHIFNESVKSVKSVESVGHVNGTNNSYESVSSEVNHINSGDPQYTPNYTPVMNEIEQPESSPPEGFANLSEYGINLDLILKSIFFGAIFYLLSLPEVYKLTSQFIGKKVDNVLVHSLVYAILYYILVHFI